MCIWTFSQVIFTSVSEICWWSSEVSVVVCSLAEAGIIFWIFSLIVANGCVITSRITSKVVFVSVDAFSSNFCSKVVSL